jgi:hypothetical protein
MANRRTGKGHKGTWRAVIVWFAGWMLWGIYGVLSKDYELSNWFELLRRGDVLNSFLNVWDGARTGDKVAQSIAMTIHLPLIIFVTLGLFFWILRGIRDDRAGNRGETTDRSEVGE